MIPGNVSHLRCPGAEPVQLCRNRRTPHRESLQESASDETAVRILLMRCIAYLYAFLFLIGLLRLGQKGQVPLVTSIVLDV